MTAEAARDFITRVEKDKTFAAELEANKDDPDVMFAKVRTEGFDLTPAEVREAFLDRYGAELRPEQLEAIAAGALTDAEIAAIAGTSIGVALAIGTSAVAAAV